MDRLMTLLDGLWAGKKPRGIAQYLWKREDVAAVVAVRTSDSWMRSQVRRWIAKAQALTGCGRRARAA